jgi:hypothetical protein
MQELETYLQLRGAQVLHYGPGGFSTAIADSSSRTAST